MRIIIFVGLLLQTICSFSQTNLQQHFGTQYEDIGHKIITFNDNTFIICSIVINTNGTGYALTKMDTSGQIRWSKVYFDSMNISISYVVKTFDNCLLVLADRYPGQYLKDLLLTKIDTSGNILWNRLFSSQDPLFPSNTVSLHETRDHGFIITAFDFNSQTPAPIVLIKTDSAGNQLWNKSYSYPGYDNGGGAVAIEMNDGSFLFSTSGFDLATMQATFWMMAKLDSSGNIIYMNNIQDFDPLDNSEFHPTQDGKFLLFSGLIITCLDSNATPIWIKKINSPLSLSGSCHFSNGQFAVTGMGSGNGIDEDVLFIMLDSAANVLACETIGGSDVDLGNSINEFSNGRVGVLGATRSFNSNGRDVYFLQRDSLLGFGCNSIPLGIFDTMLTASYVPDSMVVSGISITQSTIQISDSVITPIQEFVCNSSYINKSKSDFEVKIFPNPFSETLYLSFNGEVMADIIITDAVGRTVFQQSQMKGSPVEISINVPGGLYFLKINSKNLTSVYRIIKF